MGKDYLLEKLKKILFEEHDHVTEELSHRVEEVERGINVREELESRVDPILEDKVGYMQQNFNFLFGPSVTQSIKQQIEESKDEVVEALYPIIGRMVKRYVVKEFEVLSEKVDRQMDLVFSWEAWWIRIKSWFGGAPVSDALINQLIDPVVEEIFLIEQHSGLLLGSYSRNNTFDQDMIAGMMTAIKSFAEDAFAKGGQGLETIEYETYKLILKNFQSFYIVAAISGPVNATFKSRLDAVILDFVHRVMEGREQTLEQLNEKEIAGNLETYFSKLNNAEQ